MKRIFALTLILVCLFSFTSCKKYDDDNTPTTTTKTTTTESLTVTVTFPEGYTVKEAAELLEKNKVCTAAEFIALSNDIVFLKSLGYSFVNAITDPQNRPFVLEGYIFPDTYEFYRYEGAEAALERFLDNTQLKLTDDYINRAKELGYTIDEIITLASVIQEESSEHIYMANVSSVIHNRLESPDYGRLECDVSIHYINDNIKDSSYITYDLDAINEHYDTYEKRGLPLGAICNPGTHAIEAALYPAETDYYFFVTDENWNYYFNESWEAHDSKCRELGIY